MTAAAEEELARVIDALPAGFFVNLSPAQRVQKVADEWRRALGGTMPYATVTKDELIGIIDEVRQAVLADDSFEGSILYDMLDPDLKRGEFKVRVIYRHGNSMGQGSLSMIGVMPDDAS